MQSITFSQSTFLQRKTSGTAAISACIAAGFALMSFSGLTQQLPSATRRMQDTIDMPKRVAAFAADKFAVARPLNIEVGHLAPYRFKSNVRGSGLPESEISSFSQARVSANVQFLKRKTWMLGTTLAYRFTAAEANITMPVTENIKQTNKDFHYFMAGLNFSWFTQLYKKRLIFSATALTDGSEQRFERMKALFTGTMILKADARTKMSLGFLVNIDASTQSPVLPTFTYEHKFKNGYVADLVIPRYIYLRKYAGSKTRLSLGAEMDRTGFYLYNLNGSNQRYEYRQIDINSGAVVEYAIANHLIMTARTGIRITPSGRIFKKAASFADPEFKTQPAPVYYLALGVSWNPFMKQDKSR